MAVSISLAITQNSQSIANNTSNVTVSVTAKWTNGSYNLNSKSGTLIIDGTSYSFASAFNTGQTTSGSAVIATKTVTIAHNSDGSKTLSCSASYVTGVSSGTVTASASKTLTAIARASSLSVGNGTLGTAQTLTVTRQSTGFTHTVTYKCGSASGTICTKSTSTSIGWTPLISLASQNTTGTSVSITFTITTYNGDTSVGSATKTISCSIPATVKPSCTLTISDAMGYAATYGGYVKGKSKFKIAVTPTTSYGSAIASYSVAANGSTYTSSTVTTGVVSSSGTLAISATVKDQRGRSGSANTTATVLDYTAPTISTLSVGRCDLDGTANDQGAYVKVTFNADITSLGSKNTAAYKLQYKKSSETEYTSVALTAYNGSYSVSGGNYIFAADTGSTYNVALSATDAFGTTVKSTTVSTAFTLMHWLASGLGMAVGKVAELANYFEVGLNALFRKNVQVDGTTALKNTTIGGTAAITGNTTIGGKITQSSTSDNTFAGSVLSGRYLKSANGFGLQMTDADGTYRNVATLNSSNYFFASGGIANNVYIGTTNDQSKSSCTDFITLRSYGGVAVATAGGGTLRPSVNAKASLGNGSYRWTQLYAMTSTISTSDRNCKTNIQELDNRYLDMFMELLPVSFQLIEGTSGRTHIGFIAQDVEAAMQKYGISDLEFAGFCKDVKQETRIIKEEIRDEDGEIVQEEETEIVDVLDENGNPEYIYSLRYEEFIALNTAMIQRHEARIRTLGEQIQSSSVRIQMLEAQARRFEERLNALEESAEQ